MDLKERHCVVISEGTEPLKNEQIKQFREELLPGWQVIDNKLIKKEFPFENFKMGMAFAQEIAMIAEKENHHPDICIHYTNVEVELSTHSIGGLSENDFIIAAKIDDL